MVYLKNFLVMLFMIKLVCESSAASTTISMKGIVNGIPLFRKKVQPNNWFNQGAKPGSESENKITIVGAGNVGTAVAITLILQYVTDEIVLIDRNEKRVRGEVEDLQHGTSLIRSPTIIGGTEYKLSKNSRICIVTAGRNQKPGQSRLDLVQGNLNIFRKIIPQLIEHSPDAVILIITNPVDIMTYVTWKLLGEENPHRIIGSGTNLDSSRLRFLIGQDLNISPTSLHGWVIGEHGDSSVTVWSGVDVGGANLASFNNLDQIIESKTGESSEVGNWYSKIQNQVINSAYEIIKLKGYTSWAVGISVANLAFSIIHDVDAIHAVSVLVKGQYGIKDDVFLSLPCVLGRNGINNIISLPLDQKEKAMFLKSAETMLEIINKLDFNQVLDDEDEKPAGEGDHH